MHRKIHNLTTLQTLSSLPLFFYFIFPPLSIKHTHHLFVKMAPPYFPLRWETAGDQWWYASPIDCAAANGHNELVRHLLTINPDQVINLTSLSRIRRLEAVWDDQDQFNNVAKCRARVAKNLLLETNKSLINSGHGSWLLYTAASAGDVGFVQDLIKRNHLLVFGEGEYGVTEILYAAAKSKSFGTFRRMFDVAIDAVSFDGELRWEMMNRGVHCAARGGSLEVLKGMLDECGDVLEYRDAQGSTILHSAASKGQVEVMNYLTATYNIIDTTDLQGNTSLHTATYFGFLPAVEALLLVSPSLALSRNKQGDTFLHAALAGFQIPGSPTIHQRFELLKHLINTSNAMLIQHLINMKNNQGRTLLHMAVSDNIQADLVQLLLTIPSIDPNIVDSNGVTPLDLLRQQRRIVSVRISLQPPGTSFRLPDSKFILESSKRLKGSKKKGATMGDSFGLKRLTRTVDEAPLSLRKRFLRGCLVSNNRRIEFPSLLAKERFTASLMQGVMIQQAVPRSSMVADEGGERSKSLRYNCGTSSKKMMNHYFCFGAQGLAVENLVSYKGSGLFQMDSACLQ